MIRNELFAATAVLALLSAPAMAQNTTTEPAGQPPAQVVTPEVTTQPAPAAETAAQPAPTTEAPAQTVTTEPPPATEQTAQVTTTTMGGQFVEQQEEMDYLASDIMDTQVQNAAGEDLGAISDIVLSEDGSIKAVVVGIGGFLGIGERDVGMEWDALQVSRDEDGDLMLQLDATREQLEQAPEFRTVADIRAEEQAATMQQTPPAAGGAGGTTAPAPALGGGGTAPAQ